MTKQRIRRQLRAQEMARLHEQGLYWTQIGRRYRLTGARVGQIVRWYQRVCTAPIPGDPCDVVEQQWAMIDARLA